MSKHRNASEKEAQIFFLSKILILFFMVFAITANASVGMTATKHGIEVDYVIRIDIKRQKLFVNVRFTKVPFSEFLIGFPNRFIWSKYDGTDLAERISGLEAKSDKVRLTFESSNDDFKLYSIQVDNSDSFTLSYTFDTARIPYNFHFTSLSPTSLHIPGLDFFIRVFKSVKDVQPGSAGLALIKKYSVEFENLPVDWEIVSTYSQPNDHSVVINDLWGAEVLLSAGKYRTVKIDSGEANIRVAINEGLKLDVAEYSRDIEKIFRHFYSVYKHIPESQILLVVNQDPRRFHGLRKSFGGQVKKQNIINSLGWGGGYDAKSLKRRILGHLAHEGHHIWYAVGFQMKESWYWCQEGFTEYLSEKSIYKLGMGSYNQFKKELARRYSKYNRLSIKNSKNLVQTSIADNPTREERDMNYHKGMLVAYLLDDQLQRQGKDLEQFLSEFYQTYAIPGKAVGNQEIITFIDETLGDDTFTQKYVSGTETIPLSSFKFGWKYYWWVTERYLPPLLFPWNLLVAGVVIMTVGLITFAGFRWIRKWAKNSNSSNGLQQTI